MTPAQIERVRKSFARVVLNLDQVSALFCQHLRALDPSIGPVFGGDPLVQRLKVGAALAGLVGSLGQVGRIRPALQAIGRERARQGVDPEHYEMVGEALVAALEQALGDAFDAETRRAWVAAYHVVALTMIGDEPDRPLEAQAA